MRTAQQRHVGVELAVHDDRPEAELEPQFENADLQLWALNTTRRWRHVDGALGAAQIDRDLLLAMRFSACSALLAALWLGVLGLHHSRLAPLLGSGMEEYRRVVGASFWTFGVLAIVALLAVVFAMGYLRRQARLRG